MNPTGVYVPIHEVFPGAQSNFDAFTSLVRKLSRTDALFWCARLNLIISNPQNPDHRATQQYGLSTFFTPQQIDRINRFARIHGGADKVTVFFRGQLLELIRWVCLFCQDQPGDGETFNDPEIRETFAKVVLLASDIWARRVIGDKFSLEGGVDAARQRALGAIRQAIAETSSGIEPLWAVGRGRSIFGDHFPQFYPDMEKVFTAQTRLSLDEYYTCLCAMIGQYLNRTPEKAASGADGPGLFSVDTFCDPCPHMKPVFSQYLALESQTPDELSRALWGSRTVATPNDAGRYDFGPLRRRPIVRSTDARAIIVDPVFYAERGAVGPLFYALQGMDSGQANQIFAAFGQAFEAYAGEILRRVFPEQPPPLARRLVWNLIGRDGEGREVQLADACLNNVKELVLFEIKAAWVRDDIVVDEEPDRYLDHLREKYGVHGGPECRASVKGVGQLARTISRLAGGEWRATGQELAEARRVYPVLVVHDQFVDAPVHSHFLATEFARCLQPDGTWANGDLQKGPFSVLPLIVMTIDDLESLETSLEHFGLCDLLRDYSAACRDRIVSLHNFVAASHYGTMIYYSRGVARKSLEILKTTMKALFPEASS